MRRGSAQLRPRCGRSRLADVRPSSRPRAARAPTRANPVASSVQREGPSRARVPDYESREGLPVRGCSTRQRQSSRRRVGRSRQESGLECSARGVRCNRSRRNPHRREGTSPSASRAVTTKHGRRSKEAVLLKRGEEAYPLLEEIPTEPRPAIHTSQVTLPSGEALTNEPFEMKVAFRFNLSDMVSGHIDALTASVEASGSRHAGAWTFSARTV